MVATRVWLHCVQCRMLSLERVSSMEERALAEEHKPCKSAAECGRREACHLMAQDAAS